MQKLSLLVGLVVLLSLSPRAFAADQPAMVKVMTNAAAGTILTDGNGRTLYLFTGDERNKSNCTESCLQLWTPLLTAGDPQAGEGVNPRSLRTITRADGQSMWSTTVGRFTTTQGTRSRAT